VRAPAAGRRDERRTVDREVSHGMIGSNR
jgi:hypothetical protein